jgi:hypothetical protein
MTSQRKNDDDALAYGEYHGHPEDENRTGDRGFLGDVYHRLRGPAPQQGSSQPVSRIPKLAFRYLGEEGVVWGWAGSSLLKSRFY